MNKAEYQARNSLDKIAKQANVAAVALSGIGVAVGALAAREILKASEAMDAMGKRAQGLGVAVAPLTEISYQAEKAGLGLNELDVGLRRVSRTAYDAARGNDAAVDVFKTMGIAVTDTAGNLRSTESLWRDVADWFAKTEDSSYKAGVGYKLFGTQVTALTPILNEGSAGLDAAAAKARELGIVFDGEAASAAARLNDSLFDLKKRMDGFWMAASVQTIPILSDFTEALFESDNSVTTLAGSVQSFARDQALLDWINVVGAGLAHLTDVLVGLAKLVQAVKGSFDVVFADTAKFSAWVAQDHTGLTEMFDPEKAKQQKAEYERLTRERDQILEDANKKWSDVWNFDGAKFANAWEMAMTQARARIGNPFDVDLTNLGAPTSMAPIAVKPAAGKKGPKRNILYDSIDDWLGSADGMSRLEDVRKTYDQLDELIGGRLTNAQANYNRELQAMGQGDWARQINEQLHAIEDQYQNLMEQRRNSPAGLSDRDETAFREAMEREKEMVIQHYDDLKQIQGDWILGAQDALINYSDHAANVYESLGGVVQDSFKGMDDALADFVTTGKANFSDLADSIIKDMIRIAIQQSITGPLAGALGSGLAGMFGGPITDAQATNLMQNNVDPRLFDGGGFTGAGGKYEPAGIVHKGEYVLTKEATSRIGVGVLDRMNKGYANGGLVGGGAAGAGAVSAPIVNITNTGTPQAAQGQPRIRTDEMGRAVIDIVLGDIQKNGRLGQTLRRGL
ncbi:MAG: phage tail tape measure protein [Castellaniella sp.]|nr:phage tail tape measure protein [Castellaniella sp.]